MYRNKYYSICIILTLVVSLLLSNTVVCYAEEPAITAKAGVVMEATTGTVVYDKNMHEVLPPASITKVMTLLLIYEAMERGEILPDSVVTTSEHAANMGGSQVYLEVGEQQTVETLIKCICISSANDACVAMAEYISGTEDAFVEKMNKRAKELGMLDTNFVNCCGLDADGHVSSAYDVALMSRELMQRFPQIMQYTTTWMDSMVHKTKNGESEFGLTNTNKLIRQYEGITGLKTGSTSKAMYCLSATANRNGTEIIAVVLAAPDTKTRFKEATSLLNYGFSVCKTYQDIHEDMEPVYVTVEQSMKQQVELIPKEPFCYISTSQEDFREIREEIIVYDSICAPVKQGDELGMIQYYIQDKKIGTVMLVAKDEIKKAKYMDYLKELLKLLT